MRDPYDVLGVSRKASEAEIKKAFRTLAKKHHPDTHANDPKAVKKFQEISAAYEVVGDKEKRAQYDRGEIDEAGQPKGFNPGAHGYEGFRARPGGKGPGGFDFHWTGAGPGGGGGSAEDIFADILGSFGGGKSRKPQPQKGADLQFTTSISLQEAAQGSTRRVMLGERQLEVRIPSGVKDGQQIRLRGQGNPGERGGPPGDALITVSIAAHPYLVRDGLDLRMDLPITLKEAVLGAKVNAPTLTGEVALTVPPHSNTGKVLRLKGKGLPGAAGEPSGDLYIKLVVALPDSPDPKLDAFVKGWDAAYDPRAKLK